MLHQIQHLAAVAPLIVVPCQKLYEMIIQHDTRTLIEDTGIGDTLQIGGYYLILYIRDDALHATLGSFLHLLANLFVGCRSLQTNG